MARLTDERAAKVDKAARFHWEGNPACWDTDARILDLLDRVAALEAERDAAQADCKAMARLLDATPGDSLGQQMTPEEERFDALLCATYAVRRWRP